MLGVATLGAICLLIVPALLVRPVRFPRLEDAASFKVSASSNASTAAERMVTVAPGVKVQVIDWGGTGRPLLFLAGLGSDAHVYGGFAPQFKSGYHVYGMTRRGFGASDKPAPTPGNYAADRLGDDVLSVLNVVPDEKQLTGGPGWMRVERFDIKAKSAEAELPALKALPPSKLHDQMQLRLQMLLEQRFEFKVSFTPKQLPYLR